MPGVLVHVCRRFVRARLAACVRVPAAARKRCGGWLGSCSAQAAFLWCRWCVGAGQAASTARRTHPPAACVWSPQRPLAVHGILEECPLIGGVVKRMGIATLHKWMPAIVMMMRAQNTEHAAWWSCCAAALYSFAGCTEVHDEATLRAQGAVQGACCMSHVLMMWGRQACKGQSSKKRQSTA